MINKTPIHKVYRFGGIALIHDEQGWVMTFFIGFRLVVITLETTVLKHED